MNPFGTSTPRLTKKDLLTESGKMPRKTQKKRTEKSKSEDGNMKGTGNEFPGKRRQAAFFVELWGNGNPSGFDPENEGSTPSGSAHFSERGSDHEL